MWLPIHHEVPLTLQVDGHVETATFESVDLGQRVSVPLSGTHTQLEVGGRDGVVWAISLRVHENQVPDVVVRAKALAKTDPDRARANLRDGLATLSAHGRAHAHRALGEFAFRRGDYRAALESYFTAYRLATEVGLLRMASEVTLTCVYICILLHELDGAQAWVQRHEDLLPEYPPGQLVHGYYRGLVAKRQGDLRQALLDYIAHAKISERLGQSRDVFAARSEEGVLRGNLGDFHGAVEAYAQAASVRDAMPAQIRGTLLNNRAWTRIEARARGRDIGDPLPLLKQSLALYGPDGAAPDPRAMVEVRLNLAYAHVLAGRAEQAAVALPEVEQTKGARQLLWRGMVAAEIAALQGEVADAIKKFAELGTLAAAARDFYLEWFASVRQAELEVSQGNPDAALGHYRAAEQQLDRQITQISVDAGREQFCADRARSSWGLVALLLERQQLAEAACVARLARARTFQPLRRLYTGHGSSPEHHEQQKQALARFRTTREEVDREYERSWTLSRREGEMLRAQLSARLHEASRMVDAAYTYTADDPVCGQTCEALRRPGAGELLLVYYPQESGWVGFAITSVAVVAQRIAPVDPKASPERLSEQLLVPFTEQIAAAERLRLIPSRELLQVDFHALPLLGEPLISHIPIAYALDLPRDIDADARAQSQVLTPRAVVVAPPSNLAAAAHEATYVEDTLKNARWQVEAIVQREATLAGVSGAIVGAGLLHFVGHARGDGLSGWDSSLELAGDSTLSVADVLALDGPAPTTVVLNGCETGITDPETLGGGMSLALAFLLAGSKAVIATGAEVDDRASATWVRNLYAQLGPVAITGSQPRQTFVRGTMQEKSPGQLDAARLLQASWGGGEVGPYRVWVP